MQAQKKKFKIIAPPIPKFTIPPPPAQIDKKLKATQQVIEKIQAEIGKCKLSKAEDPEGTLKNITLAQYTEKNPQTGQKIKYPQIYTFKIVGRSGKDQDYYKGHYFKGRIEFPDNYPTKPPKIFMDFLPSGFPVQMVNIYADGQICHHTINEDTYKQNRFDLPYIMKQLEGLLYNPNPKDPANGRLGQYFQNYPEQYWKFQKKQAQELPQCNES